MLHLDVPSGMAETEVEVTIILQPVTQQPSGQSDDLGWPPGFFENVIGGWQGGPLRREDEGAYETREEL
jgi:hypothetical protein